MFNDALYGFNILGQYSIVQFGQRTRTQSNVVGLMHWWVTSYCFVCTINYLPRDDSWLTLAVPERDIETQNVRSRQRIATAVPVIMHQLYPTCHLDPRYSQIPLLC